jgi:hypothetical protein
MNILASIFRLSFRALEQGIGKDVADFDSWSEFKMQTYEHLNKLVFEWVSSSDFSTDTISENSGRQLLLDALHEIIFEHYEKRLNIYDTCVRLGILSERSFTYLSLMVSYAGFFRRCASAVYASLKCRTFKLNTKAASKVVFAIGFPEHAFSVGNSNVNDQRTVAHTLHSSFGEYFLETYRPEATNTTLITIDEYVRASKSREQKSGSDLPLLEQNAKTVSRYKTGSRWSALVIVWQLLASARQLIELGQRLFKSRNRNWLANIFYFIYWSRSISYFRMAERVGGCVEAIYALPFGAPLGLIPYIESSRAKLVYFNYSQNLCEPPTKYLNLGRVFHQTWDARAAMADMSPDAWRVCGKAVGFNDVFEYMNSFRNYMNSHFGYRLPLNDDSQPPQLPMMLGYETVEKNPKVQPGKYIVVFDVPPEEHRSQYMRHFCGSPFGGAKVVEEFLNDLAKSCRINGFRLVLKPKYSLDNYSPEYRKFLFGLREIYGSDFGLLSPYSRIDVILSGASASVNMPYTSTKIICDWIRVPSVYYLPLRLRWSNQNQIIFGEMELNKFLSELKNDSFKSEIL